MKLVNPFGFATAGRLTDWSLLLLRITFGSMMFINHGLGKFQKFTSGEEIRFPSVFGLGAEASMGLAVFSEVVCAILIILGLFTRLAAIPLIFTMLYALLVIHIDDPIKKMESAILFLVPFIILFWQGGGKYSVDEFIS
jgi:putative oxidoreductase